MSSWNRLVAVINANGTTDPFPMYRCTPALYTPCGVQDEQKHTDELRQWTERNAGGAESCALGVEGGVGAGGVAATHPDKETSVGLGEDGLGESATKESEAASPSAAGGGDTTAAADEMVADDTTTAADATVASTVAATLAVVSSFFAGRTPHRRRQGRWR